MDFMACLKVANNREGCPGIPAYPVTLFSPHGGRYAKPFYVTTVEDPKNYLDKKRFRPYNVVRTCNAFIKSMTE